MVNPGTVGGVAAPATYVLGDLDTMTFVIRDVALEAGSQTLAAS